MKRSTCSELFDWLNPYEENIINLEPFEVKNLPRNISGESSNYNSPNVNLIQSQEVPFEVYQKHTQNPSHQPLRSHPQQFQQPIINPHVLNTQPIAREPETYNMHKIQTPPLIIQNNPQQTVVRTTYTSNQPLQPHVMNKNNPIEIRQSL